MTGGTGDRKNPVTDSLFVTEQLTQDLWVDCCTFFRRNPNRTAKEDVYRIPGLKGAGLFPYQLLRVYWMLLKDRGLANGDFLRNEIGLGKVRYFLFW
jgi:hypothetical protein